MLKTTTHYSGICKGYVQRILFQLGIMVLMLNQVQAFQSPLVIVKAKVINEKKESLHGVTIKIKGTKKNYATNEKGFFIIEDVSPEAVILIQHVGYKSRELSSLEIRNHQVIILQTDVTTLKEATINQRRTVGTEVDIKHKQHMTLAQVLEGGVPGLVLKSGRETKTSLGAGFIPNGTSRTLLQYYNMPLPVPWKVKYRTFKDFEDAVANGQVTLDYAGARPATIVTGVLRAKSETITTNTGIVPELRGANSFSGETKGMLVVIDGFVQKEFPANYPMNNIASIVVIRDPAECLKWGAKGAGGVILITTNLAKPGELQVNYNSNFYFTPRPDISADKLRLASSADLLDYYKEIYDKNMASYQSVNVKDRSLLTTPIGLTTAEMMLFKLYVGKLTPEDFNSQWESLGKISNRDQLRLLRQNAFSQNHSLNISGGTKAYRFTIGGIYEMERSNLVGFINNKLTLNLKNNLSLWKDNLKINWIADVTKNRNVAGATDDGSTLEPYQLLLDEQGGYLYNYSSVTPDQKIEMNKYNYQDAGVNLLEDIRNNSNTTKLLKINSSLNIDWKLMSNLRWSTSLTYSRSTSINEKLQGEASSQSRTLINQYGSPIFDNLSDKKMIIGVDFYVPRGGVLKKIDTRNYEYNIRSGIDFNHHFGSRHVVTASLDAGISSQEGKIDPASTVYGYDIKTGVGLPILAPLNSGLTNFFGSSIDLGKLLTPDLNTESYSRSVSLNANISYSYLNRYSLNADQSTVFSPDYGGNPPYSTTSNRSVSGSWQVNKEPFLQIPWISSLKLTIKGSETQVAKLPVNLVSANRILQPIWDNAAITVDSYNKTQQSGQKSRSLNGILEAGLSEQRLLLSINYTLNSIGSKKQWNARLSYDIAREPYFNIPFISSLQADVSLQDINPYQGLSITMGSNSISSGGGFSMPGSSDLGLLPPSIKQKEAHLQVGIAKERLTLDLRHYHKTTAGLSNGDRPTDPATGLGSQVNYSVLVNKGLEMSLRTKVIQAKGFDWTITMNGAYNVNQAVNVPQVNFTSTSTYLRAQRNGYSTDNVWGFRWAGLDALGNPQVYNKDMQKVTKPDSSSLVYLGRKTAPWSGALIQELRYNGFFASSRLMFNFGHIMRKYMPVPSYMIDKNIAIRDRWRGPGEEAFKDVATMATVDPIRTLIIRGADNTVIPADNLRLREIQFGYEVSQDALKGKFIKTLTISAQVQNVALWTRNKLNLDPEVVSDIGAIGETQPRNYVLSINMSF